MSDWSGTFVDDAPLARSSVPLAGAAHVFRTQTVRLGIVGFGIGSGVPKLHPVSVQSGPGTLTAGPALVATIVQSVPVQSSPNRLIEPSGVGPSEMIEAPPPMLRPAAGEGLQDRGGGVPRSHRTVPPAADSVKSRMVLGGIVVGVVVGGDDGVVTVVLVVVVVVTQVPCAVHALADAGRGRGCCRPCPSCTSPPSSRPC